jgi:hypothetical protein
VTDNPRVLRPWDILPGESVEDFEAFTLYLNTDGATVAGIAKALHRTTVLPIATRHRWRARKAAYVSAIARETETAAIGRARELGIEHAEAVAELRSSAFDRLREAFLDGDIAPSLAAKIFASCLDIERLDAGKPTARTALDLAGKTDQELAELERLLRPAGEPSGN